MPSPTIFLSRLLGLFTAILALTMAANRDATVAAFVMLVHDPAALWVTGMVGLAAGLALVLSHNRWSGGAPAIVVTLYGWAVLLKSILVLVLPAGTFAGLQGLLQSSAFFYADSAFLLALGLTLAVAGFTASPPPAP